jgi:sarcosine oxidase subunit alpha
MSDMRVKEHPVLGSLDERSEVVFSWNGRSLKAQKGEVIASALLANGIRTLRRSEVSGAPRGMYCAIGHCMECRVRVNGVSGVRACLTPIEGGEVIDS